MMGERPRSWWSRGLSASAATILLLGLAGCVTVPSRVGSPAGQLLSLPVFDMDEEPTTLEAGDGRTMVVVIWATWCDPCSEALQAVEALFSGSEEIDVATVAVDADHRKVADLIERVGLELPVHWDPLGEACSRRLALERVPTSLIIGADGRIQRVLLGWDSHVERALSTLED